MIQSINMKKILLGITLFSGLGFMHADAQKPVNEVTCKYDISISSAGNDPLAKSFEGASLQLFIKGNQSRTEMKSGLGTESAIYDAKSGKGFILKEYSGQKLMITLTKENWLQKNQYFQNMIFKTLAEEKKVGNFDCKKAIATLAGGESFIVYYTPDIILNNKQYNNAFGNLPGLPVQYEIQSGKLTFIYTLKSVSFDLVPSATFEIFKSGFRVMSYQENQ